MSVLLKATSGGSIDLAPTNTASNYTITIPAETATLLTSSTDLSSSVKTALNATGSAPIYACRAWVNFNGTGTVAIRASGNVSSITDNGVGDYTVNFSSAMTDTNYVVSGTAMFDTTTSNHYLRCGNSSGGSGQMNAGNCRVNTQLNASTISQDCAYVMAAFHR